MAFQGIMIRRGGSGGKVARSMADFGMLTSETVNISKLYIDDLLPLQSYLPRVNKVDEPNIESFAM